MRKIDDYTERFWERVDKSGDCWVWTGAITDNGYGIATPNCTNVKAHRLAWMLEYGQIPKGMKVLHRCDNKPCVRLSHLFIGTSSDNAVDCTKKGRNPRCQLTPNDVRQIRRLRSEGMRAAQIADRYGMSQGHIQRVVSGISWAHVIGGQGDG